MTKGFEATALDDIGEAIGVGRRTITRCYPSKNDMPWGQFDRTLDGFRETGFEFVADVVQPVLDPFAFASAHLW